MLKKFLMKKMMKSQLKGVPEAQQEVILKLVEENPDFFEKIAKEIKQKTKEGKSEMSASMEVMRKYQGEMMKLMK
ncbi:hypothetical protein ACFLY7_02380 [Patescibacteria group bacterium]